MADTRPRRSSPITPALTPDSTVSMKRLRSWASSLAAFSALCWSCQIAGHAIEGVGQGGDLGRSAGAVDPRGQVAARDLTRRLDQPPDRAEMLLAADIPSQTAPTSTSSAVSR